MARDPTAVAFTCMSCNRRCEADARKGAHILPWMRQLPIDERGMCRKCGGERWTISVFYVEENVEVGVGYNVTTTNVNQRDFVDVSSRVVAELNEVPIQRLARVAQYAHEREREEFIARGAIECQNCNTLFIPTPGKVWGEKGFCSKICIVDAEGSDSLVSFDEPAVATAPMSNTIAVQCAAGHQFEVSISFKGLRRPCPVCGSKTAVP